MAIQIDGDTGVSGVNGSATTPALQGTDSNTGIVFGTDQVQIATGGSTRATVDSSGNVGIGTSSPTSYGNSQATLVVEDDTNPAICWSDTGQTRDWWAVANGSNLSFNYADGGGSGSASNVTTALSMTDSGDIGIGTTSPSRKLHVAAASNDVARFESTLGSGSATIELKPQSSAARARIDVVDNAGDFSISTVGTADALLITNSGSLHLGTGGTSLPSSSQTGFAVTSNAGMCLVMQSTSDTGTNTMTQFINPNGTVGTIQTSGSSTSYNTSSDYRLKENLVDISDGITRVKQLAPKRFNFIGDDSKTVDGFLAHEAQAVVPEAVTGTHNEVDDDGNAVMQGIDQSKLVPLLTAALQEAIGKIETLESQHADLLARVTALEAA